MKYKLSIPSKYLLIIDPCYLDTEKVLNNLKEMFSIIKNDHSINSISLNLESDLQYGSIIKLESDTLEFELLKENNINQKVIINQLNNNVTEFFISDIAVDSNTIVLYDAEIILSEWSKESNEKRVRLITTTSNTNLINKLKDNFEDIMELIEDKKHIEKIDGKISVKNIEVNSMLFNIHSDKEVLLLKIIEENPTTTLKDYNEYVEIIDKDAYYYLRSTMNDYTSINQNKEKNGFIMLSGDSDGYFPIKQFINKNTNLVATTIDF